MPTNTTALVLYRYIVSALTLTVGFAMIVEKPEGQHPGSWGDDVADVLYFGLVLFGTINSVLGVWWAGHIVPQCTWHPAAEYSKFWYASLSTTMGQAQKFSKVALLQLVLVLIPACYLNWVSVW